MNLWRVPIEEKTGKVLGPPEAITTPSPYIAHLSFSRATGDPHGDYLHTCQCVLHAGRLRSGKAQVRDVRRRCGDRFWRSQHFACLLFNWHSPRDSCFHHGRLQNKGGFPPAPQTGFQSIAASFVTSTGSPHQPNSPDISLGQIPSTLIGNPISVRRPVGLHRIQG